MCLQMFIDLAAKKTNFNFILPIEKKINKITKQTQNTLNIYRYTDTNSSNIWIYSATNSFITINCIYLCIGLSRKCVSVLYSEMEFTQNKNKNRRLNDFLHWPIRPKEICNMHCTLSTMKVINLLNAQTIYWLPNWI